MSFDKPELAALCLALNICVLNDIDYAFLNEFKCVMRPIADGLTALEGNICFGAYLPHLFGISSQLNRLKTQNLRFCKSLLSAIDIGFNERFRDLMDPYHISSVPLYLAMMTNPKYKMSFIGTLRPTLLQKLKNMLLSAAEEIAEDEKPMEEIDQAATLDNEDQTIDEGGIYFSQKI